MSDITKMYNRTPERKDQNELSGLIESVQEFLSDRNTQEAWEQDPNTTYEMHYAL